MRLQAPRPNPVQRALPYLVGIAVLSILVAVALWARQQDDGRSAAVQRADRLEVELAAAQASLTAIVRSQATASATALARAAEPGPALERALQLVFSVYQDPSDAKIRSLSDVLGPAALAIFQREADYLRSNRQKLGGTSSFTPTVVSTAPRGGDRVEVRTRERWVYDERNANDARARCIVEESEQTYVMRQVPAGWIIEDVQLGTSRRTDCPA
jgi:hypothetical protein